MHGMYVWNICLGSFIAMVIVITVSVVNFCSHSCVLWLEKRFITERSEDINQWWYEEGDTVEIGGGGERDPGLEEKGQWVGE